MNKEQEKKFFELICVCNNQQQELKRYKNIVDKLEKRLNELIKEYEDYYKTSPVDWEKRKGVSNTWLNSRDCYWSILNLLKKLKGE